jgi:hypothetical protein
MDVKQSKIERVERHESPSRRFLRTGRSPATFKRRIRRARFFIYSTFIYGALIYKGQEHSGTGVAGVPLDAPAGPVLDVRDLSAPFERRSNGAVRGARVVPAFASRWTTDNTASEITTSLVISSRATREHARPLSYLEFSSAK